MKQFFSIIVFLGFVFTVYVTLRDRKAILRDTEYTQLIDSSTVYKYTWTVFPEVTVGEAEFEDDIHVNVYIFPKRTKWNIDRSIVIDDELFEAKINERTIIKIKTATMESYKRTVK